MPELDLKSREGLRLACDEAEALMTGKEHADRLQARIVLLQEVQDTGVEQTASVEFLERVWFDDTLARLALKRSHVEGMSQAIADEGFRSWFAERIAVDLPTREDEIARVEALEELRRELLERTKPFVGHQPLLMANRVLSALFPEELVHLSNEPKLFGLLRAMGGHCSIDCHVRANSWIRNRLEEILGQPEETLEAITKRQYLPELLWDRVKESEGEDANGSPSPVEPGETAVGAKPFSDVWGVFRDSVDRQGLRFKRADVESLHLGLWADDQRHFAVLAGLSGTGKTQLGCHYGRALVGAEDDGTEGRLLTVRVQPGWHDPAPLLGYSNPLAGGAYQRTEFLNFLLSASECPTQPHVCILDEMNLSHPEQYLAPLLSAMEQPNGVLDLHSGAAGRDAGASEDGLASKDICVPERLTYPSNLVLIGTVNMDETTMGISDKVLDRAFTLEFWDIEVEAWPGWGRCKLNLRERDHLKRLLSDLMAALQPARLHFGWRVIAEIVHFLEARGRGRDDLSFADATDRVIYAKVLPKLRGDDSPRFGDALKECERVLEAGNLGLSARKVKELNKDREALGSFRFWR